MNLVDLNVDKWDKWSSVIERVAVLIAMLAAAVKLKVFGQWQEEVRTEMESHCRVAGDALVWADYTITNIGDRPFDVRCVRLVLCDAKVDSGGHLLPDEQKAFATTFFAESPEKAASFDREFDGSRHHFKQIEPLGSLRKGERTIFTLRCRLNQELPEVFFIAATWWRCTKTTGLHRLIFWFKGPPKPRKSFFHQMHVQERTKDAQAVAQTIARGASG